MVRPTTTFLAVIILSLLGLGWIVLTWPEEGTPIQADSD